MTVPDPVHIEDERRIIVYSQPVPDVPALDPDEPAPEIRVPLAFWFDNSLPAYHSEESGLALPVAWIPFGERYIRFEFATLENILPELDVRSQNIPQYNPEASSVSDLLQDNPDFERCRPMRILEVNLDDLSIDNDSKDSPSQSPVMNARHRAANQ
jgi:hypothetical protein